MWIVAAVFAGVIAIVFGAYYLLIVRQEEQFLTRLTPTKKKTGTGLRGVVKAEEQMSSVEAFDTALRRSSWAGRLQLTLDQSGLKWTVARLLLTMGCFAVGAYMGIAFLTRMPLLGLFAGGMAGWMPYAYVMRARTKRLLKFEEQFPEAIDLISRALRAGHALPTGLSMAAEELSAPVGAEFRTLYDEQNFGLTLPDALRNFARRIPVLDAQFFVTAVLTQRESGGNLAEVLDNLASVIRERFKVKRQVRVISAHGRITGWVLAGLPPSLAFVTLFLNPDHLGTLTGDPLGRQMIVAAVSLQVVGTLVIRRIVNVEY